jgi:hypothetical protein
MQDTNADDVQLLPDTACCGSTALLWNDSHAVCIVYTCMITVLSCLRRWDSRLCQAAIWIVEIHIASLGVRRSISRSLRGDARTGTIYTIICKRRSYCGR